MDRDEPIEMAACGPPVRGASRRVDRV